MLSHDALIDRFLALSPDIRYVAVYRDEELRTRERSGLAGASTAESDRYEELLVNPTVLTMVRQRGNIDCGGLRFIIVAYGNFYQLMKEIKNGHISICLDKKVDLTNIPEKIFEYLKSKYAELY